MSRKLLLLTAILTLLSSSVSAKVKRYWGSEVEVELKKDKVQEIKVFGGIRDKSLFFRWTLYINSGLVVITHYDRFPHQYILYKQDYRQDSFKIRLNRSGSEVLVQFRDFNLKKKSAKFSIFSRKANIEVVE